MSHIFRVGQKPTWTQKCTKIIERAHGEHVEGMWKSVEECGIKRNPSRTPRWNMEDVDMWKERGTLGLHVGGTLDFSTLEDKEASFDGTLVQMCLKGQLMVTRTLMSHGGKRIY